MCFLPTKARALFAFFVMLSTQGCDIVRTGVATVPDSSATTEITSSETACSAYVAPAGMLLQDSAIEETDPATAQLGALVVGSTMVDVLHTELLKSYDPLVAAALSNSALAEMTIAVGSLAIDVEQSPVEAVAPAIMRGSFLGLNDPCAAFAADLREKAAGEIVTAVTASLKDQTQAISNERVFAVIGDMTQAAITAIPEVGLAGETSSLSVKIVAEKAVAALPNAGISENSLGAAAEKVLNGATSALGTAGFERQEVSKLTGDMIGSAFDGLEQAGVTPTDIASATTITFIISGAVSGLSESLVGPSGAIDALPDVAGAAVGILSKDGFELSELKTSVLAAVVGATMDEAMSLTRNDNAGLADAMSAVAQSTVRAVSNSGFSAEEFSSAVSTIVKTGVAKISAVGISSASEATDIASKLIEGALSGASALVQENLISEDQIGAITLSAKSGAIDGLVSLLKSGALSSDSAGAFTSALAKGIEKGLKTGGLSSALVETVTSAATESLVSDATLAIIESNARNEPPIAKAGADQTINENEMVFLTGRKSFDPEGQSLSYAWKQIAGTSVDLDNPYSVSPAFVAPNLLVPETMTFQLVVNDGFSNSDAASVNIAVTAINDAPVANAGADQSKTELQTVTLSGEASIDPEGSPLTYAWVQTAGTLVTLDDPTSVSPSFTIPNLLAAESMRFQLVVNDGASSSSEDTVTISVSAVNAAPVADGGPDQSAAELSTVTLTGLASTDPEGRPLVYAWSQVGGSVVSINEPTSASPTFTIPNLIADETMTFQLVVNDGSQNSNADLVDIFVSATNAEPIANAGTDQSKTEGDAVTLNGSGSLDPEGQLLSYSWSQTAGTSVTLSNESVVSPTFVIPALSSDETLTFQLEVNDGNSTSASDTVDIFVTASDDDDGDGILDVDDNCPTIANPALASFGPASGEGAPSAAISNVPEASQYTVMFELDIPVNSNNQASAINYAVNRSASYTKQFQRVAYYLELENGSEARWVWVSMDAFTADPIKLGIPNRVHNDVIWQQKVDNMNVYASGYATTGLGISTGNIEMWTNCYGTAGALGEIGGDGGKYDWNDTPDGTKNCYGSFQVHNWGDGSVVFAYNAFDNGATDELGIGSYVGEHKDYTFAGNAGNWSVKRKLYILVAGGQQQPDQDGDGLGDACDISPCGDGTCLATCQEYLAAGHTISGHYLIDPPYDGSSDLMHAYCDMESDGGGWTMVLNYVNNGTATAVNTLTDKLPTFSSNTLGDNEDGATHFGHSNNALVAALAPSELLFYAKTDAHSRLMNFKTDDQGCIAYFSTGTGDCLGMADGANTTALAGHTAYLPGAINQGYADRGDLAMTDFPFYKTGEYHWGIDGNGDRWEVDQVGITGSSTIHRIFVRSKLEPVAKWSFDESSGTTVADSSGSGNTGTLIGGVALDSCGDNRCVTFDGTGSISIGTFTNIPTGDDHYAIVAWIKTSSAGNRGIVGWGNFGTSYQVNALRMTNGGGLYNYWWAQDLIAAQTVNDGEWHMVAAQFDGTERSIWIDGVKVADDQPSPIHNAVAANFFIGQTNGGERFIGSIDEVEIYDRALTGGELQHIFNRGR